MFSNIPGHRALDASNMVPVATTKNSPDVGKFTFGDKIGPSWEPLFYTYSKVHYSHLLAPAKMKAQKTGRRKSLGLRQSWSSIRKVGDHQQKVSSLHSRQKGRTSISWLNCLSVIAWLASFSTRASLNHFSQKQTLPTFRVKWKSSGLILSRNHLDWNA